MKAKSNDVSRLARQNEVRGFLFYGPDQGACTLATADVQAARNDAGALETVVYDGDAFPKATPDLLDAGSSIGLFEPSRILRIRNATDKCTKAIEALTKQDDHHVIVVEAGELAPRSTLRKLFEASKTLAALPFYEPDQRHLARVVQSSLEQQGIRCDSATAELAASRLPPDTMVATQEALKLATYCAGKPQVEPEDVQVLLDDGRDADIQTAVLHAANGNLPALARHLWRLSASEASGIAILRLAQRHFERLHRASAERDAGATVDGAMSKLRPPVFFKEKRVFEQQLRLWGTENLERAMGRLVECERRCKQTGNPTELLAHRTLTEIAMSASRGSSR